MSSSLGKRKEREDDGGNTHGFTLFVSNLPYTATSVDLQTLFSDIAPVRSAFVVLEPGSGVSKGVGYVSFAIKEDAQTVHDNISKDGLTLAGRKLRVQWAENKEKDKTVSSERKRGQPTRPPQVHTPYDPLAIRTIIVSGLPSSIDSKALWKKIRKCEGAEKVDWPVTGKSGDDPSIAHVLFTSPAAAYDAVNKLHAHVFKGCLLSVTLKKRLDNLAKPQKSNTLAHGIGGSTEAHTDAVAVPSRASRLIVRNLPFNASEQDLRAIFLPYGPIHSIHIPTAEGSAEGLSGQQVRTKGFAFVWMLSKKDAEKAIEGCNGMEVRAGMAEGMVLDKQKKKKQRRVEKKMETAALEMKSGEDGDEAKGDKTAVERVIAVDWALSKQKWAEEKAKVDEGDTDDDADMEDSANMDDSENTSEEDSDEDGDLGVHKGGDESSDEEGSDNEILGNGDQGKPIKPQLPPPETGTTLFIRNVPFTATEDELRTLFRSFGPLRYARITVDGDTGRSRGTGFACFWNKEDADKAVEQSRLLRTETTGSEVQPKKNPFTLPSILTPDPSSALAQSLVLHGRTLDVVRAVTRDEAGKLKEEGERKRAKADKRNIYLLKEGVILPNSTAAETLGPSEIERRTASYNARRALLRSNPSLYVSRNRLSVRQIPIFVTERVLKRLSLHAVRAFNKEVRNGSRPGLTDQETAEETLEGTPTEDEEVRGGNHPNAKGKRQRPTDRRRGVKQAKIVRQQERVDPVTGKGRSRGYGFVEMNNHADALRVLRWANNNSDVGPLFEEWWKDELKDLLKQAKQNEPKEDARLKRIKEELEKEGTRKTKGSLIVEFSIENVQVVQRRNAHQKDKLRAEEGQHRETLAPHKTEGQSPKKRRLSENRASPVRERAAKPEPNIGSLIGRKRKERRTKRKGGS